MTAPVLCQQHDRRRRRPPGANNANRVGLVFRDSRRAEQARQTEARFTHLSKPTPDREPILSKPQR